MSDSKVFTHFNDTGRAKMVDVSLKHDTARQATAVGYIQMKKETLKMIQEGTAKKGDVLGVAQVAGIMAAKKTSEIIPMCHPIFIQGIDMDFSLDEEDSKVVIQATVRCTGATGVEMEALHAVTAAALTIYDMCKAVDKKMVIGSVYLQEKEGGKSGHFTFDGKQEK